MDLLHTKEELRAVLRQVRADGSGRKIALVPTMGALHAGHGALIEAAARGGAFVVVSVFVNPTQFAADEDLARYPRDLERDAEFAARSGADLLFAPSVEELYSGHAAEPLSQTTIAVGELGRIWEGALRPTHFAGVALVVTKLLSLVGPEEAYFGEKDYQQLCVIRQLACDLDLSAAIIGVPTVREPDGLALSSRNRYLDAGAGAGAGAGARARAGVLFAAISAAQAAAAAGERDARRLEAAAAGVLQEGEGAQTDDRGGLQIGYCALVDPETLQPIEALDGPARLLISVTLAGVHLIDNAEIRTGGGTETGGRFFCLINETEEPSPCLSPCLTCLTEA
ncbi:MAG: pantoate--beta-alanine ligase [Coriobacteriia bacterium]|nr:pantoate--beta-alanine ligase [Coriobacteriia bacterium]